MMHRLRVLIVLLSTSILLAVPVAAFADTGSGSTSFAQFLSQLEQQYQLPSGILWKVALAESSGNSNVCASTSSACGMFQFITSTWENDTRVLYNGQPLDPSLRSNPSLSAKAAAYELDVIRTQIGGLITQANVNLSAGLYLGYFLGSGGAKVLLQAYMQNPGQSACALLPKQCAANRSVMANQTLAGLINWASQKMSVSGVPNVAGNFSCSNGVSYAYSYCDLPANGLLPANTVIPANPYGQYATPFPSPTTGTIAPITGTAVPVTEPVTTIAPGTASGTSQCTPQYYCSNNTVYYQSDSCSTSVFEQCQYGCLGTICAPSPSATSSLNVNTTNTSSNGSTTPTSSALGSSVSPLLNTSLLNSSISTIIAGVQPGQSQSQTTAQPTFVQAGEDPLGTVTLTTDNPGTYTTSNSLLFQLLDSLKSVLNGLLSYLDTL